MLRGPNGLFLQFMLTVTIFSHSIFGLYLMWKLVRIVILLVILAKVMQQSYAENASLNWQRTLHVTVYPINAEHDITARKKVDHHIHDLTSDDFETVTQYFTQQAKQYQLPLHRPIQVSLGNHVSSIPPEPPNPNHPLSVMVWSLKFRFYAWMHASEAMVEPDIKLYLVYHDPDTHPSLSISTALNKGRIGRINLFGDGAYHEQNLVVLAHELLHTVKATDKYHGEHHLPVFPDGFADPNRIPLYPQAMTELMAGRLPISHTEAEMPERLSETIIGKKTAEEIGWLKG